jgi:alkylation response protein AidB-like acyl-CoA dehydrogenase
MDFGLSEIQEMLRKTARDFLTIECPKKFVREMEEDEIGYSPQLWRKMAELGWLALPFPEKYGGNEGGFLDLVILLEEMGRACLPSPFIPMVVMSGLTIVDSGTEKQKDEIMPRIINGDLICTLALNESPGRSKVVDTTCIAVRKGKNYLISGTILFVPEAHIADYFLVCTGNGEAIEQHGDTSLFLVDTGSPGIICAPLKTIASDKQYEVIFDNVEVPEDNMLGKESEAREGIKRMLQRAAVAKCAEMVGGAAQCLEMTVNYAKERIQFGQPIGSFQAIQHYCAKMAVDVDAARLNTYEAAWMIDEGIDCAKQVAIAKAWVSEAYQRVTAISHQVHGTIAFTRDMDVELYIRRAKAGEIAFGDADYHREIIAQEIGL